jgi:glutamate synthase (NADPH/NADH) large chain
MFLNGAGMGAMSHIGSGAGIGAGIGAVNAMVTGNDTMVGGVAYVWNKDGNFDFFCNMEMVELSLIEEASYRKELHELIRQHYLYTGSKLARTMLDDWNKYVDQFIQVVPIEYKKVLQEEQMQKLQQKIADMQRDY